MLQQIKIKNFAIIENIEISFSERLNILSGETGAGKTTVINALKFILGSKSSLDLLRTGAEQAEVEAVFVIRNKKLNAELIEFDLILVEDPNQLLIRRILGKNNISRIYINDKIVSQSTLKQISRYLVDICSQFENQSILSQTNQIELLDQYCKNEKKLLEFRVHYEKIQSLKKEINQIISSKGDKTDRADFVEFQIKEIVAVNPKNNEDEELGTEHKKLLQDKQALNSVQTIESQLYGEQSVLGGLETIQEQLKKIKILNPNLNIRVDDFLESYSKIEEIGKEIKSYRKSLTFDSEREAKVVDRLEKLNRIKKKNGGSISSVLEKLSSLKKELDLFKNSEKILSQYNKDLMLEITASKKIGLELHELRTKAAKDISDKISNEFQDLYMKGAKAVIEVNRSDDINSYGYDQVSFYFIPNIGEKAKTLEKIASAGELSRVILAIHKILIDSSDSKTYIFDEVDTGIGGEAGKKIGKKLQEISKKHQVICITHLPQVAVFGEDHFILKKQEKNNRVSTHIDKISDRNERIEEIARMLSGNQKIKEALDHAKFILEEAKSIK